MNSLSVLPPRLRGLGVLRVLVAEDGARMSGSARTFRLAAITVAGPTVSGVAQRTSAEVDRNANELIVLHRLRIGIT